MTSASGEGSNYPGSNKSVWHDGYIVLAAMLLSNDKVSITSKCLNYSVTDIIKGNTMKKCGTQTSKKQHENSKSILSANCHFVV